MISIAAVEVSYRRSMLWRLLGNPIAFTVVSLLANANGMSTGKLRRPSVGAFREPTIFSEHCDCRS